MKTVFECLMDKPITRRRKLSHEFDYGDDASIGAQLKRINYQFGQSSCFGEFVGYQDVGYVVLVYDDATYTFNNAEVFATIDEMKQMWQLD